LVENSVYGVCGVPKIRYRPRLKKGHAWASKVDADQLRSIKVTLNNWGQIDDWTLDSDVSAKIHDLTAVTV
jgi:hypothetical protein